MSEYDREHIGDIIYGGLGDWFNARLLRALDMLLSYADDENRARLEDSFPEQVAAYEAWYRGDAS